MHFCVTHVVVPYTPHHSAPRLGSVCPNEGLNPWAAAMGHPWPSAANPASCRVTHGFKPAFGQRGLTGRLRSKARSRATRFASWIRWRRCCFSVGASQLSERNAQGSEDQNVGAGLLAKASAQQTLMLPDPPLSRASSAPTMICGIPAIP